VNDSSLVTIAKFDTLAEAQVAKSLLDSREIKSFIANEHMNALYGNIVGAIFLQVHSTIVEVAKKVLKDTRPHLCIVESDPNQNEDKKPSKS